MFDSHARLALWYCTNPFINRLVDAYGNHALARSDLLVINVAATRQCLPYPYMSSECHREHRYQSYARIALQRHTSIGLGDSPCGSASLGNPIRTQKV
jgi:hypothetical protein